MNHIFKVAIENELQHYTVNRDACFFFLSKSWKPLSCFLKNLS
jgi:hypothetical protein